MVTCILPPYQSRSSRLHSVQDYDLAKVFLMLERLREFLSTCVEVWTLVGATWHWSDLTFIEPSVVKLDHGKVSASDISSFNIAL